MPRPGNDPRGLRHRAVLPLTTAQHAGLPSGRAGWPRRPDQHARNPLSGEGTARRRPADIEVPEIGDELATARALADLAYKLLDATADDIEQFTRQPVRLTS
ncbi:dsRBD fold-containing protein [Paractinoplanes rishiriensis]|uniref:Uncharacterized protein n=1 Tax=Paractinoplanes rishiriensis TaxID=1050105 RepID=A0A919N2V3_9ACTN|nr:dsRBD fold-containing protein [Actinoplanes rishiriensis]GIF02083.1 hypothetical protein Ari01nite_95470 [Actinoplanes rishiriensis]